MVWKAAQRLQVCLLVILAGSASAWAQVGVRPASQIRNDTTDWMKKVADWQLTQSRWDSSVSWERAALHAGLMACYEATKDETYLDKCRQYAQKFSWRLASTSHHADNNAVGQVFMELYLLDQQDPARYAYFKNVSDTHVAAWPAFNCNTASGSETWWWCDALFMAPPGLVRLSRATGEDSYTALMHNMWADTQNCLYDTEEHLFYRDITYLPPANYNGEKIFWSRGNGWVLAGIARVLQYLPPEDPTRPQYISLLQQMAAKLAEIQLPDGYWHSDLLSPQRYDNPETSGTGFFTFGIAWGINNGYLDETTYGPTVQAGWQALNAAVQPNGLLGWVQPVGADPKATTATTTDVFGVGAYLLAASEVQKYLLSKDPTSIDYFESYGTDDALRASWTDGTANATASQLSLGVYGDKFLELTYANDQPPYHARADCTFAGPRDFTIENAFYLSVLVRGNPSNAAAPIYVRLEDANAAAAMQVMPDTAVVQTSGWMELAFPLSDFGGIDLTQISKLSIGLGLPDAVSPAGQGTIRIDNIRLSPCVSVREDLDGNCQVDINDVAELAGQWLEVYVQPILPTDPGAANLAAYWPLDGDYLDAAGSYDAQAGGNPTFVDPGHSGKSVYFDSASYLNCQNSTAMHLSDGAAVSAWIKSSGVNHAWACVIAKGISSWRLIRNNTGDTMCFHFSKLGGGEYQANGSTPVFDNQWHHLMGVYEGNEVRLYVDGQLDAASPAGAVNTTNDPVYIGSRIGRVADRSWDGEIDEVRVYHSALTEANIYYLAEASPAIQIDNPRPADLHVDGTIDLNDLQILVSSWLQDVSWP